MKGGVNKHMKKIGKHSQSSLTPRPNPLLIIFSHFLIGEHIDADRPPRTDISKGILGYIYIEFAITL